MDRELLSQVINQLRAIGLVVEAVDETTGRVVVLVPEIGER